ncbi:hypothetical protein B0E53_06880 [Micromonospora sp. MH33]|nr:hypothetical protein B0E53_06880 [Micromonospora sp. MH33]
MGVRAADPERGDAGPAGPAGVGPRPRLGQQLDRAGGPVDVRGGAVDVQGGRQPAVPHGQHHLDHAGHSGGGLGVADVRLDRPEQQRGGVAPVLPVRGQQRLRLDRVAEGGAGAVRLDDVDLTGGESRVRQRLPDDPSLGGAVRGGQPAARAVLVDRAAADHGEHGVTVAAGVGQPLDQQHADPLRPARAVGGGGERLAPAVGGQAALPGELDEDGRGGHHRHPAGQGQGALPQPQRLAGQVQRDQRRRAGGVHGDRRPFEAEGVRDPAAGHGGGAAGAEVALDPAADAGEQRGVVALAAGGRVHAGGRAAQRGGVDAGGLERLPGGLQQQPLLRVHGQGLPRADAEEGRVEVAGVGQEAAVADVGGAPAVRVGVVERVEVPAAVGGERGHRVPALGDQLPELLRRADAAREPAAHPDDRHRFGEPVGELPVLLLELLVVQEGRAQRGDHLVQ